MAFSPEEVDPDMYNQKRLRGGVYSQPRLTDFASSRCNTSSNGCDGRQRSRPGGSHLLAVKSNKRTRSGSSPNPRLSHYASSHAGGSKPPKSSTPNLVIKPDGRTDAKNKVNQQESLTWKCNHCGMVLKNTRFKIKFQKWYHITKTHPHIDKSAFDQMRNLISAMISPTNIPHALRAWTCAKCDLGLPLGMKYTAKRNAAWKHLKNVMAKTLPRVPI